MGVEMNIPTFHIPDPLQLLPSWLLADIQVPQDEADSDVQSEDPDDNVALRTSKSLLSQAVTIPGLLHVLDNILTDINERLEGWSRFWEHLQALAKLLCNPALLERYVVVLLAESESPEQVAMFVRWTAPALYEKRWHIVISFVSQLLPRLPVLMKTWNRARFQGEGVDTALLMGLEKALTSNFLWAYTNMVYEVHIIFSQATQWLESCSCHEGLYRPRRKPSSHRKPVACPMRGRSASRLTQVA